MKTITSFFGLMVATSLGFAGLPVITSPPQDLIVPPGSNAVFSVIAADATSFQWRFKGDDIPGATNSTLVVTNTQYTNSGYYSVVAKNATGWVPSPLAYLSVVTNAGILNFSNGSSETARAYSQGVCDGNYGFPILSANAQLLAGPVPDKLQPVGSLAPISGGYINGGFRYVPTAESGATTYCRVDISFPNCSRFQPSATIKSVLAFPTIPPSLPPASLTNIVFPWYIEWPDPVFNFTSVLVTNQTRLVGENVNLTLSFYEWAAYLKKVQWRKDGKDIPGATNYSGSYVYTTMLTLTNLQASDAGVYDVVVSTTYVPAVSPKSYLNIQLTNGGGIFRNSRFDGVSFLSDLEGVPSRNYRIQWSANLSNWSKLMTVSNVTGTVTFTNSLDPGAGTFYRAELLP